MKDTSELPERSGGIDFDHSDAQAQDVVGRDKIELNLPPILRRGCYAQLAENVKITVVLGALLLLIYAFFQTNLPRVNQATPTPTISATATPTATPQPPATPVEDGERERTATAAPPSGGVATAVNPNEGTPLVVETPEPASTPVSGRVTATPTLTPESAPIPRPATPTSRPTPTPAPPTPSPRPAPTNTLRPATPMPDCPSTSVRLGPVAKLVRVGDVFTMSARVSCAKELAGYQVELSFDPSVVIVQRVDSGGFMASAGGSAFVAGPDVNNDAGTASIGAVVLRPGPYPYGSGTLASFTLKAVAEGSSDLGLSASLSNASAQPVPLDVSGAAVVVKPASTPTPTPP
ncbi:MAG: hypothetical protein MAG451_01300 [Anaerolineales bacterium]|nr:hypothetical protein [Anaerolineales bacterium]